ncbi:MAG TPA: hypothetical protein VHH11_01825 [Gammaproteobacteria bacterium]|nr:hypothetical protein [Gammaproteobacteria bacterium]
MAHGTLYLIRADYALWASRLSRCGFRRIFGAISNSSAGHTMGIVHTDPQVSNRELRDLLYRGEIVVLTGIPAVAEFVAFMRQRLTELFAPHDPRHAHLHHTPVEMARILGVWKPKLIHDPRSRQLLKAIVTAAGFDPATTMYDVPKPRTSFPSDHLTTGIAYAFPWHRDTWYAAPAQQINWWFPVYDLMPQNAMKFDPRSFAAAVDNDSAGFDSYQANRDRLTTARQVGKDTRSRPGAGDHTAADELVLLPKPGQVMVFSGAHLHASIPNTSGIARYSVDFRIIDRADVEAGVGAPMVDVHCSGTMLREFRSVATDEGFPEEFVRQMAGAPPEDAILVFDEKLAEKSTTLV